MTFPSMGRAQSVAWVSSAPAVLTDGDETMDSGQINYLIRKLPQFTNRNVRVSPARSLYELQHGEGMCSVGILVTPEREALSVFSRRHMSLPSFRLMVKRERLAEWKSAMTPKGEVDLAKVEPSLIGGFTNSRHYDPVIADFIQQRGGHIESLVATFQLFNLLQAKRIDFAFVMPPDLYFYGPKADLDTLVLLPVKGVVPTNDAAVACTKDDTGRAVIKAIDALLAEDQRWVEFVEPYRAWIPPEDYARVIHGG